jgi:hypothetical protein
MEARTKPIVILVGAVAILLVSTVLFGLPQVRRAAQIGAAARARLQMEQWARAAEVYRQTHGSMPAGDSSAVLETLRSENASRKVSPRPGHADQEWQVLDPWGTPWRIQDGERIEVRSAGPNRQFGDEDDFSSLSVR